MSIERQQIKCHKQIHIKILSENEFSLTSFYIAKKDKSEDTERVDRNHQLEKSRKYIDLKKKISQIQTTVHNKLHRKLKIEYIIPYNIEGDFRLS